MPVRRYSGLSSPPPHWSLKLLWDFFFFTHKSYLMYPSFLCSCKRVSLKTQNVKCKCSCSGIWTLSAASVFFFLLLLCQSEDFSAPPHYSPYLFLPGDLTLWCHSLPSPTLGSMCHHHSLPLKSTCSTKTTLCVSQ